MNVFQTAQHQQKKSSTSIKELSRIVSYQVVFMRIKILNILEIQYDCQYATCPQSCKQSVRSAGCRCIWGILAIKLVTQRVARSTIALVHSEISLCSLNEIWVKHTFITCTYTLRTVSLNGRAAEKDSSSPWRLVTIDQVLSYYSEPVS